MNNPAPADNRPEPVADEGPSPPPTSAAPPVPHIRFAPHIPDVRHCLYFEAMDREVPEGTVLKVGRFTDRVSQQPNRIAFKSKVVSRSHAEIWSENGHFYIRDTKSSSGTFLNHIRLSVASAESLPKRLHDGDILQLGVDYQGGIQDIYKCVKIRLEINRAWQRQAENPYRMRVMKNLQNMFNSFNTGAEERHECCICLYAMGPFQALFVAPCSHCFHFKCIKPIIFTNTGFSCPLCRTFADLEAPVEEYENDANARAQERLTADPVETTDLPPPTSDHLVSPVHRTGSRVLLNPLPDIDQSHMMDVDSVAAQVTSISNNSTPHRPDGSAPHSHTNAMLGGSNGDANQATPVPVSAGTARTSAPGSATSMAGTTSDEESTPGHSLSRAQSAHRTVVAPATLNPHHHTSPTAQVAGHFSNMTVTLPPVPNLDDSSSDAAFLSEDSVTDPLPSGNGQSPPANRNGPFGVVVPLPRILQSGSSGIPQLAARAGVSPTPSTPTNTASVSTSPVNLPPPSSPAPHHHGRLAFRIPPLTEAPPSPGGGSNRRRAQSCFTEPTLLESVPDSPMTRTFAEGPPDMDRVPPGVTPPLPIRESSRSHQSGAQMMTPTLSSPLANYRLGQAPTSALSPGVATANVMARATTNLSPASTSNHSHNPGVVQRSALSPFPPTSPGAPNSGGVLRKFRRRLSDHSEYFQNNRVVNTAPPVSTTSTASPLAIVLNHLRMVGQPSSNGSARANLPPALPLTGLEMVSDSAISTPISDTSSVPNLEEPHPAQPPGAIPIPTSPLARLEDDSGERGHSSRRSPLAASPGSSNHAFPTDSMSPASSVGDISDRSGPSSGIYYGGGVGSGGNAIVEPMPRSVKNLAADQTSEPVVRPSDNHSGEPSVMDTDSMQPPRGD